jgi:hypothetical protein
MENQNLTEEESKYIDSLREEYETLVFEIGINEVQTIMLKNNKESLIKRLNDIQQKEQEFISKLSDKNL